MSSKKWRPFCLGLMVLIETSMLVGVIDLLWYRWSMIHLARLMHIVIFNNISKAYQPHLWAREDWIIALTDPMIESAGTVKVCYSL